MRTDQSSLADALQGLVRQPYPSEVDYFQRSPNVSGMATEDRRIILNPNSPLSQRERDAVVVNEGARLTMDQYDIPPPQLTRQQSNFLGTVNNGQPYGGGNALAQQQTMIGRILSGDPTAFDYTQQQADYASKVKGLMYNRLRLGSSSNE